MATDRRTRFREYMRRLDPTGDPAQAVAAGFYVPPPGAVSARIATRLELEPGSSHLLVGGIGSGKTTELIAIERRLAEVDDLLPVRVDVPSRHRLDRLKPGVLIAVAGLEACRELNRERELAPEPGDGLAADVARISTIAHGYFTDEPDWEEPSDSIWVPGILEAPELAENVRQLADALKSVQAALRRKLVLLFDGLDRVANLEQLAAVLVEDVGGMRRAGVGLVLVAPQHLRFSPQRVVEKGFETVHLHGATSADTSEGQAFLTSVLRARTGEDLLPEASVAALVGWSGGLLRDLIALARAAGAEAYAGGGEMIQEAHVETAADRFGRDLILGCTREMAARLRELALVPRRPLGIASVRHELSRVFTVATEVDQRLLLERLIIEIPGTPVRYVLHPTIAPLVSGLGAS
jgi:hypothetical protein